MKILGKILEVCFILLWFVMVYFTSINYPMIPLGLLMIFIMFIYASIIAEMHNHNLSFYEVFKKHKTFYIINYQYCLLTLWMIVMQWSLSTEKFKIIIMPILAISFILSEISYRQKKEKA